MSSATGSVRTAALPTWRDWRAWPDNVIHAWRRSLRFRTLAVTLGLTALTILVALVWMALAIQNDLFESRVAQVEVSAQRATLAAQASFDSAAVEGNAVALQNVMRDVQTTQFRQAATDMYAMFRISPAPSAIAPQDVEVGGLWASMLSDELRAAVVADDAHQSWQSIAIPTEDGGVVPGVAIGQQIVLPEAGAYELYFAYDLASEAETLRFVQVTLWGVDE